MGLMGLGEPVKGTQHSQRKREVFDLADGDSMDCIEAISLISSINIVDHSTTVRFLNESTINR